MITNFEASGPIPPAHATACETTRAAARKERQDALLDDALLETFPASDPVSVARVA